MVGVVVRDYVLGRAADDVRDSDFLYAGDLGSLAARLSTCWWAPIGSTWFGNPSLRLGSVGAVDIFPPPAPDGRSLAIEDALGYGDSTGNAIAVNLRPGVVLDPMHVLADLRGNQTRLLDPCWSASNAPVFELVRKVMRMSVRLSLQRKRIGDRRPSRERPNFWTGSAG
jgi:hypothetical protein